MALAVAAPLIWWSSARVAVPDPNIVLIVIDALRADRLGCYGYSRPTSPNIDRLAREGVLFERAITQGGWTRPAIGSLFTATYPHSHGAIDARTPLSAEALTIAEKLEARGYFTIGVQTNPFLSRHRNFSQGFKHYREMIGADGPRVVNELVGQLGQRNPQKFFAYLHFLDVHTPYKAPKGHRVRFLERYEGSLDPVQVRSRLRVYRMLPQLDVADRRYISNLYDSSVSHADEYVGRLMNRLAERGILDDTLFIVTSDHGEELFDHGGFEHGHSMYQEIVRVPLIIKHPRLAAGGLRIKQLVRHVDIFPTLMGFLRLKNPPSIVGRDLGPAIEDPDADWRLVGLTESTLHGPKQWAVQQGHYKVIEIGRATRSHELEFLKLFPQHAGSAAADRRQLYDLASDPLEKSPLNDPAMQSRLVALLDAERRAGPPPLTAGPPEPIDPERLEQLRSLGYIDSDR